MRRTLLCTLIAILCGMPAASPAQDTSRREGTIVRMRMSDCLGPQHGIMAALSGTGRIQSAELCPEYVLVTDKVVYTIIGKSSSDLLPLAETTRFRFQKNQLLIRIDDARHESKFDIKEMVMRSEWERIRQRKVQEEEDLDR